MWPNPQFPAGLAKFSEVKFNGKLHFYHYIFYTFYNTLFLKSNIQNCSKITILNNSNGNDLSVLPRVGLSWTINKLR